MDIYNANSSKFKPTYLYIKTHLETGLKYFGKTISKDPFKYKGSGKYWKNHLKIYGNNVTTEIFGYYTNEEQCIKDALQFSIKNNIIESEEWANLKLETLDGGMAKGQKWKKETLEKRKTSLTGMVNCKDINGNKFFVTKEEFYNRQDLFGLSKGIKLSKEVCEKFREIKKGIKQSEESKIKKSKSLIGKNKGKKRTQETKDKLSLSHKGKIQSEETKLKKSNSMKGKNTGKQEMISCPHCGKTGGISGIKHYHFDNCKFKSISIPPFRELDSKCQEE